MQIIKEKSFYKEFFGIWSMLVLYNVITLGVNLADNIMVGSYSEVALSGVSAINQVQFLFQQLVMGAGDAVVVMGSQYWGQKRTDRIKLLSVGALILVAALSIFLFLFAAIAPELIAGMFSKSPEIRAAAVEYLDTVKYTYLIFALTNILLAVLRSVETVKIGFWVSLSTLVINCSINYFLIEGNHGAPELGVTGAAIGTLAARIVELALVVVYIFCIDKKLIWKIKEFFIPDRRECAPLVKDYFRIVRPFLFTSTIFGVSVMLQSVILGHMNDSAIAANSVASTLFQLLKVASIGAASAASILIGKAIGSGRMDKIKSYTQTLQIMFIGIGVITSVALFLLKDPIIACYDLLPETAEMAGQFIIVLCITGFGTAYQMPVNIGIVRGGGDAKIVKINDLISIWGIVLPLSFAAAFLFNWSPVVVVFCLNSDQLFKCVAACIKVNRYRWMKKLTR